MSINIVTGYRQNIGGMILLEAAKKLGPCWGRRQKQKRAQLRVEACEPASNEFLGPIDSRACRDV